MDIGEIHMGYFVAIGLSDDGFVRFGSYSGGNADTGN